MNDTGTICQCYISITCNEECFLMLFVCTLCRTLVQWLIFFIFQIFTLICLQNFICRNLFLVFCLLCKLAKNRIKKCTCHVINISICCLNFRIILFRIYTKTNVRRQCPWCGCPCKEIRIFTHNLKSYDCRTLFDILISLRNLLCRKRCSTTWAVRNDLKSFIEKTFVPDFFERPPLRLDKFIVVSNIRILHIRPETNGA